MFQIPNVVRSRSFELFAYIPLYAAYLDGFQPTDEMFAICNYVPPWHGHDSSELVRQTFKDVFTFYPRSAPPDPSASGGSKDYQ